MKKKIKGPVVSYVYGFMIQQNARGDMYKVPVSLSDQFRGIEAMVGAKPLDHILRLELKPVTVDSGPNSGQLGVSCMISGYG